MINKSEYANDFKLLISKFIQSGHYLFTDFFSKGYEIDFTEFKVLAVNGNHVAEFDVVEHDGQPYFFLQIYNMCYLIWDSSYSKHLTYDFNGLQQVDFDCFEIYEKYSSNKERMNKKMIDAIRNCDYSTDHYDLFYATKLMKSILELTSLYLTAREVYSCQSYWKNIDPDILDQICSENFHYICIGFNDGSRVPLPVVLFGDETRPLQEKIIRIAKEFCVPLQELIARVEEKYNMKHATLKKRMIEEGLNECFFISSIPWFTENYFDIINKDQVIKVSLTEGDLKVECWNDEFVPSSIYDLNGVSWSALTQELLQTNFDNVFQKFLTSFED